MNKRRRMRKSKNALIYILIGVLLTVMLVIFGISVFVRVMEIEVTGTTKYTTGEIIEASGISSGDNILLLDTAAAENNIKKAMPYIDKVSVRPSLPATIQILVSESKAVATIDHRNTVLLIDPYGKVLDKLDTVPKGLIEVRGFVPLEAEIGSQVRAMSGGETQLRSMTDVLSALERAGMLSEVSYLDVSNISTIHFGFTSRFIVMLGGSADVVHKLEKLPDVIIRINEEKSDDATGVINMSGSSGTWRFTEEY